MVEFIGSIVAFVVALLIGGLAIYLSASVVTGSKDYGHAIITALIGAIGWALTAWIPLLGPLIALIVWIGVINWRYPGGWGSAAAIGFVAWIVAVGIVYGLTAIGVVAPDAIGVPGI